MSLGNANIPFIIKVNTDLLVGIEIRAGADGDLQKEAAHAKVTIAVAQALQQMSAGDITGALAAIDAAIASNNVDPAKAALIQTAIAWIGAKAAAVQAWFSQTLASQAIGDMLNQAAQEAIKLAQQYIDQAAAAQKAATPPAS